MTLGARSATASLCAAGEKGDLTFDMVYHAHAESVARWAARLAGPRGDVEDLTQEVFLVVYRRLGEFRGDSRVSTWLFRITANVIANDRRRRAVRSWWTRLVPGFEQRLISPDDSPLESLERRERRSQFYDVLDGLPERYRTVLILFELEEMPTPDIADLLGQTKGNIRLLLHRARAAFLKEMTRHERMLAEVAK